MRHEEAVRVLPEWLQGRLEGALGEEVERHAASCRDCAEIADSYRLLTLGLRAEEAGELPGHPTVEEIVEVALGRGRPAATASTLAHVATCRPCQREVESVRGVQAEAEGRAPAAAPDRRPPLGLALRLPLAARLAASILLAGLAAAGVLGGREWVRLRSEAAALRAGRQAAEARVVEMAARVESARQDLERLKAWSGSIALPLLAAPFRAGESQVVAIPVAAGQPFVCLVVDAGPPTALAGASAFRFEVVRGGSARVWSLEMSPEEVRRQMATSGTLAFLVPAPLVPEGAYSLRAFKGAASGETALLEVPFMIVPAAPAPHRQSPAATKAPQKNG